MTAKYSIGVVKKRKHFLKGGYFLMNIESVRRVFSKGHITTYKGGVGVYYNYKKRWVSQAIFEDNKKILLRIITESDRIGFDYKAGEYIRLLFEGRLNGEMGFYKAIEEEISLEEQRSIVEREEISQEAIEFLDSLTEEDLYDESVILQKLAEYIASFIQEDERIKVVPTKKWDKIYQISSELAGILNCGFEYNVPDLDFNGNCELRFPENINNTIWICGRLKDSLYGLIQECSGVEIECSVSDGYLNLCFYG